MRAINKNTNQVEVLQIINGEWCDADGSPVQRIDYLILWQWMDKEQREYLIRHLEQSYNELLPDDTNMIFGVIGDNARVMLSSTYADKERTRKVLEGLLTIL